MINEWYGTLQSMLMKTCWQGYSATEKCIAEPKIMHDTIKPTKGTVRDKHSVKIHKFTHFNPLNLHKFYVNYFKNTKLD